MNHKLFLFLILSSFDLTGHAQTLTISGKVSDNQNMGLPGAEVYIKGTPTGSIADADGNYEIKAKKGNVLIFSFIGFESKEITVSDQTTINVVLEEGVALDEVVLIGSRNLNRTSLETAVPIDIIDIKELIDESPQLNANQLLNYVAPSFSSTPQLISDGTDHIDPASLRGLGPDQVLVLINGKRRHTTALVNVNGTPGRGSVGTDLNAIPMAAIERIEVLRDGASAQYGSDAIAGVINIVLRKDYNHLDVSVHSGANIGSNNNDFEGGIDGEDFQFNINRGMKLGNDGGFINLTGSLNTRNRTSRTRPYTGQIFHGYNAIEWEAYKDGADLSALFNDLNAIQTYAATVSHFDPTLKADIASATDIATVQNLFKDANGDLIDFTDAELQARGLDRGNFRLNVGQPEYREGRVFMNMSLPLGQSRLYAFGGLSHRKSIGFAFYRRPNQERTYTPLHINGLRPEGHADVSDQSFAIGLEQDIDQWHTDLSNTWGTNIYKFVAAKSSNATLQGASGSDFDSWNMRFMQNTTNFDVSRYWGDTWEGLNLAFGSEYRLENYQIIAARADSWGIYDVNGLLIEDFNLVADSLKVVDFFGRPRPGGAQAFPGFRPENAVDAFRQNLSVYADLEIDFTKSFMLSLASRFEDYSDFGSTFNTKVAGRWKPTKLISLRASASTGFRAPSLHQINFSSVSTQFINGIGFQVLTASNSSILARNLGIDPLKQETSRNISGGLTFKFPKWGLSLSVDGFYTRIEDRIVLTDQFSQDEFLDAGRADLVRYLVTAGAQKVQFFTNAINTETRGVEIVASQSSSINKRSRLTNSVALSMLNTRRVGNVNTSDELVGFEETYFGERSRIFLEEAVPRIKGNITHVWSNSKWNVLLRNTYFGEVTDADSYVVDGASVYPVSAGKVLTDFSVGYKLSKRLQMTIGSNNLFDIYPDERPEELTTGGQFVYSRRVAQFGTNGRYVFARLNLELGL